MTAKPGRRDAEIEIRGRLAVAAKRALGDRLPDGFGRILSTVSAPDSSGGSGRTPKAVAASRSGENKSGPNSPLMVVPPAGLEPATSRSTI